MAEPTDADFVHAANVFLARQAWSRFTARVGRLLPRMVGLVLVLGVLFWLAWVFRYEPMPGGNGGFVWDRWTHHMCFAAALDRCLNVPSDH